MYVCALTMHAVVCLANNTADEVTACLAGLWSTTVKLVTLKWVCLMRRANECSTVAERKITATASRGDCGCIL